jgi:hypothetical protein
VNDDYPAFVHGEQGERSAQVITVDYGKHIASLGFSIAAFAVSLACMLWLIGRTMSAELETSRIKAEASMQLGIEKRLNTQAIDEMKLEMRQALKAAGVDPNTEYTHASK